MLKILAKLSAIVSAILLFLGSFDKLLLPHDNIFAFMQHESYFIAANPFILFAILLYIADYVRQRENQ